jgi:hypothetical protein
MRKHLYTPGILLFLTVFGLFSCDDNDEKPSLRTQIDYALVTPETPYSQLFVDASGGSTVDLSEGNNRYKMFQSMDSYSKSQVSANADIDAATLKSMFSNTGNPFTDTELNASSVQLKNVVASSKATTEAEAVRARFETLFDEIEAASQSVNEIASAGNAGKLGNYLLDAKGIEVAQIIQKSLIGALQLDYISNVLLDEGLTADNHNTISDKKYTQLEHNWDEAYGLFTLNPIYAQGWTAEAKNTTVTEFAAGSYMWEYNRANYAKIFPAFLKGRAAIVNNDHAELLAQATFIRTEFELTLANAALGYLDKWKQNPTDDAKRAHAFSEGLGFIYSLRFATIHGGDAAFSDSILSDLIDSPNGFWDLNATKINEASDAIKAKFNL